MKEGTVRGLNLGDLIQVKIQRDSIHKRIFIYQSDKKLTKSTPHSNKI